MASEGKKNIDAINRCFMDSRDQSTLNRFLTASPWSIQRLESKRLTLAMQSLLPAEGSTGTLIIDDTINEKTGKHMEEAGYHYDSSQGQSRLGPRPRHHPLRQRRSRVPGQPEPLREEGHVS